MKNYRLNRRRFVKAAALATAGIAAAPQFTFGAEDAGRLSIVVDPQDPIAAAPASRWALSQLQEALQAKGLATRIVASVKEAPAGAYCILISGGAGKEAGGILKTHNAAAPVKPESLVLVKGRAENRPVLLACGSDPRGLTYALLELTDRARFSARPLDALDVPKPVIEQPANVVRSIYRCFASEVEDKPWFYDREMWKQYLSMLATQRFNRFSLALGMGYNTASSVKDSYFLFAYPFFLAVPGYDVRMGGLPDAERDRNLETLKFISEETVARGLQFQLGLWSHGWNWPNSASVNYPLLGVNAENHGPYCRDALTALLQACPAISGVTFRVHGESGVPDGEYAFWETLFQAFGKCGRTVTLDMHAKSVTQRLIEIGVASGVPVTMSPKYWGEQQGMGYIQTAIRTLELAKEEYQEQPSGVGLKSRSYTRYGYGDYLREDRPFSVLHRVWPGTQKLLLSGDPALAAAYGRVSSFCGSAGFELLDPLTFKGRCGSGHPGGRCGYADASLNPKYDWEKFLYTYRVWGRLAYNPEANPDAWRRFLRAEFGVGAEAVEKALANATQVLTLVTTAHGPSADAFRYWPEMYRNMPIVNPNGAAYGDTDAPKKFGNVSPMDPQLFSRIDEYTDALLAEKLLLKYTPIEVAQRLEDLATDASSSLEKAASYVPDKSAPAFRRLAADVTIQAGLAMFFAAKMRSAVLWRIFEKTGDRRALTKALEYYRQARDTWSQLAEGARAIYVADVSFGNNSNIAGHWLDRLPAINDDLSDMEKKLAALGMSESVRGNTVVIQRAVQAAMARPKRLDVICDHKPVTQFSVGQALSIEAATPTGARQVHLFYRRVNQALQWESVPMIATGKKHRATIPAEYTRTNFPLQYYFAVETTKGPALHPGLDENFMNQPYFVVRLKKSQA